jgi:hypothetical protein
MRRRVRLNQRSDGGKDFLIADKDFVILTL